MYYEFTMYDKNDRKTNGYRSYSDQLDSGSESHPLFSSDVSSNASRDSFGPNSCMFRDSETSDFEMDGEKTETNRPNVPRQWTSASPSTYGATDSSPGSYRPSSWPPPLPTPPPPPRQTWTDLTFNRYQYYNKLGSYPTYKDPLLQQLLPGDSILGLHSLHSTENQHQSGKQSSLVTIFSVWNTIVGSSLLVLPWGIERAGLLGGIIIVLGIGLLCLYTTNRILFVHKLTGSDPEGEVPELCLNLLGRPYHLLAKAFSVLVLLGALIVYWVLLTNFLYHSVYYLHDLIEDVGPQMGNILNRSLPISVVCDEDVTDEDERYDDDSTFSRFWHIRRTAPLFLALFMTPLINFKSATFFTKFNALGTISLVYLLVMVVVKAFSWGPNIDLQDPTSPHYTPLFQLTFPALSGTLALSFFIHNIIISIMRNNRHQEKNTRDLSIAYLLAMITYLVVGLGFYICFPLVKTCISDNFLNNFKTGDILTVAARFSLLFQLFTVYPLIAFMVRSQILRALTGQSFPSRMHVLGLNGVIVFTCIMFAIFLPSVGTIIRYTGALSGFVYIFTLPILLHMAILRRQGKLSSTTYILHLAIPVIGGLNLVAQFFVPTH